MRAVFVLLFLVITAITAKRVHFALLHPILLFPPIIALYSFVGVYLADLLGYAGPFPRDALSTAFWYGVLGYGGFMAGALIFDHKQRKNNVAATEATFPSLPINAVLPLPIGLFLLIMGCVMTYVYAVRVAGSLGGFLSNLYLRQILSVGSNWMLALVLALKITFFDAMYRAIVGKPFSRPYFAAVGGVCLVILAIAGSRQFPLLLLIQAYVVYRTYKRVPTMFISAGAIAAFGIFVVYGLYRYVQGFQAVGLAMDMDSFLRFSGNGKFIDIVQKNTFDGWYVLTSVVSFTTTGGSHSGGAILLASITKAVPGLYTAVLHALYPTYFDILSSYTMNFRAISVLAEEWLDFGWFGVIGLSVLGYGASAIYVKMNAATGHYWTQVLLSSAYTYLILLVRNGLGFWVAYVSIDAIWCAFVLFLFHMAATARSPGLERDRPALHTTTFRGARRTEP